MARETLAHTKLRAQCICDVITSLYGEGECSLDYRDPYTLTLAVILSAQCTDAAVNKATPALFDRYPTPQLLAQASQSEVEALIKSLGFYRSKARYLISCARMLVSEFAGDVPNDLDALQKLPGVGRKTANVVMCEAFHNAQGIAVDTHVFRIAHRLKFAFDSDDTPLKTEQKLLRIFAQPLWNSINHQWVHFGREYCNARNPRCSLCPIAHYCPCTNPQARTMPLESRS